MNIKPNEIKITIGKLLGMKFKSHTQCPKSVDYIYGTLQKKFFKECETTGRGSYADFLEWVNTFNVEELRTMIGTKFRHRVL
jgi:hypothetical protein